MLSDKIVRLSVRIPWTSTFGLCRSILALGTLITLLANHPSYLFKVSAQVNEIPYCNSAISLFCIIDNVMIAKWTAIFLLLVIVSGWRPRVTGVVHWWVSYSFINSATLVDGGDHITSILTLLLIPYTLTDVRKWHWEKYKADYTVGRGVLSLLAQSSLFMVRLQVALIYLNAAAAKLSIPEWTDGTALYYWFSHSVFGRPAWLGFMVDPLIHNEFTVTALTWGTILFEFILFSGFFMARRHQKWLLISGVLFHFGIILIHGLVSFFFVMTGALTLYLANLYLPLDVYVRPVAKLLKTVKRPLWQSPDQVQRDHKDKHTYNRHWQG